MEADYQWQQALNSSACSDKNTYIKDSQCDSQSMTLIPGSKTPNWSMGQTRAEKYRGIFVSACTLVKHSIIKLTYARSAIQDKEVLILPNSPKKKTSAPYNHFKEFRLTLHSILGAQSCWESYFNSRWTMAWLKVDVGSRSHSVVFPAFTRLLFKSRRL